MISQSEPFKKPKFFLLIIVLTFVPWFFLERIGGFAITGWSWILALACSIVPIGFAGFKRIAFPVRFWIPWLAVLLFSYIFRGEHPNSLQTLMQMLTPFFVGCAVSVFPFRPAHVEIVYSWISKLFFVVLFFVTIKYSAIFAGILPRYGGQAPEAMTCSLLAAIYVAYYATGSRAHLLYYFGMLLFPVIMLTRGPLIAAALIFPFSLTPLRLRQRMISLLLIGFLGVMVFYSERFQNMMFYSGKGTIEDVRWSNPNLHMSGRKDVWEIIYDSWQDRKWVGHGLNASRDALADAGSPMYLPHNDWLKLLHDFGILGVTCFCCGAFLQIVLLLRLAATVQGKIRALIYGAATAFIPYLAVMFTDNVTLYVQFFGNLHFALIGVVCGALCNHPLVQGRKTETSLNKQPGTGN